MSPLAPSVDDLGKATRAHDDALAGHQVPHAVVAGPEGISILCSLTMKADVEQMSIIRLDADGNDRWTRRYSVELGVGRALVRGPAGRLVAAGDVRRGEHKLQASLITLDADGDVVASAAFGPPGVTGFLSVSTKTDGGMLAGGMAAWKGLLVPADGALHPASQLSAALTQATVNLDEINGVSVAGDGSLAIVGSKEKSTTGFGTTLLLQTSGARGEVRGTQLPPAPGRGEPAAVAALGGGEAFIVGHGLEGSSGATRLWITRQGDAAKRWWRWHGAPEEEWRGRALAVLPEGGVAAAGDALLRDGERVVRVVRFSAAGELLWERQYAAAGGGAQVSAGLAAFDDGSLVLVAATTRSESKTKTWVMRLAADGEIRWQRVLGPRGE